MNTADFKAEFLEHAAELYVLAFRMCGDRVDADAHLLDLAERWRDMWLGPEDVGRSGSRNWLVSTLACAMTESLGGKPDPTFRILDNIVRSDITRPIDLDSQAIGQDPARIPTLLWELKRTCLTRVLGSLPPPVRVVFVLVELHGYSETEVSSLLRGAEGAVRVRLARARSRVTSYLTPLCEHVSDRSTCTCDARLGVALDAKFVTAPPHVSDTPVRAHDADPSTNPLRLLRRLPPVTIAERLRREVEQRLDTDPADVRSEVTEGVHVAAAND